MPAMAPIDKPEDAKEPAEDKLDAKKAKEKVAKKGSEAPAELSEEDQELKANLELMVERTGDSSPDVQSAALDNIAREIRTATTSMTSVPKPLKFLRPHYAVLKAIYERLPPGDNKTKLADILSVLAITAGAKGERESLKFRLLGSKVLELLSVSTCMVKADTVCH